MADLGELSARISAQVEGFERGMDRASNKTNEFANTASAGGRRAGMGMAVATKAAAALSAAAIAAAAAVAAAGAGLVMLGKRGLQASDEQAKLARQLGFTNAELATLQRAAEFAGMSSSALQTNMERLTRSMGEAMSGTGMAGDAFETLGIDLESVMAMRPAEQMETLASAMDGLGSRAEQAAVAQQLFGRSGQQMLVFLDDAETNIARAAEQVDAFGLALDETDTSRIEAANDAMSSIGAVIAGIGNRIAARVAPLLEYLALKFEEVAIETRGFEGVVDGVFKFVITAAGYVANAISGIQRAFTAVQHGVTVMNSVITNVMNAIIQSIASVIDFAIDKVNELINGANMVAGAFGKQIPMMATAAESAFVTSMQAMADANAQAAQESRENLDDALSAPWPKEALEEFLAGLEEIENTTANIRNTPAPVPGTGDVEEGEDGRDFEGELQRLREFMMSQEELINHQMQQRFSLLDDALAAEAITEAEHMAHMEELQKLHMEKLIEIRKQGTSEMERFQAMSWHQQTATVVGELASLTSNLDKSNREQFEIAKAGAVAQALVNTYLGVSKSLTAYPMPLAGVMAAAHGAAGALAVSNIMSQQYGGGGGSAAGAGASAATPPQAQQQQPQQSRSLLVQGDFDSSQLFTGEAVRGLIDRIAEAQSDGYTVVV